MEQFRYSTVKTLVQAAVYFLLFLAGDLGSSVVFDGIFSAISLPSSEWYVILRMAGSLLLTLLFFWLYTTRRLHLEMEDFWITFGVKKWGVILSILLPTFVVAIFLMLGELEVNAVGCGDAVLAVAASAMIALKSGILEEMLFRGFMMKLLAVRWNPYIAILVPSFVFGLVHIPSMESFTVGGVALLVASGTMVGVMFSLAAYQGKSVSNSALMHAIWNFVMITSVLHITTAQGAYGSPLFQITIPPDNILVTGGGFGIEASFIALVGYVLVCAVLLIQAKRTVSG